VTESGVTWTILYPDLSCPSCFPIAVVTISLISLYRTSLL
jgi:hypothetical protein